MITLKPEVAEAKRGRDHVMKIATAEEWPVDLADVRVVAGELINNAIGYARTHEIRVDAFSEQDDTEGLYVLEVWDADAQREPVLRDATGEAETGRGLHLVRALTAEWGARPVSGWDHIADHDDGGKIVFATWTVNFT